MEPTSTVLHQPWLEAPETRAVIAALMARGSTVRFVGGCVRDALVGREVRDIDIATPDVPETVMDLLRAAGIKAIPTGIDHGTVTAVTGGHHFEITTLRRDVETDGRRARVAFIDDWVADAERRDFTINALYCDPDGTVYDPVGGLADLMAGRVRFIGDARARIIEDGLRILRFFRFYAWYGRGPLDSDGLAACAERRGDLHHLSGERVASELGLLFHAPDPAPALHAMEETGVLAEVLPQGGDYARLAGMIAIEGYLGEVDHWRRLAAFVRTDATGAQAIARRLKLSNRLMRRMAAMATPVPELAPELSDAAIRRLVYRLGPERFADAIILAWAETPQDQRWARVLEVGAQFTPPSLPVSGADVRALGVPRGPQIGELLRTLEDWWIGEDFRPDRAACLARLRELAGNSGASPN